MTLGTATVTGHPSSFVDISLTDDGAKAALDIFMNSWGWSFVETNPITPLCSNPLIGVTASGVQAFTTPITMLFDTVRKNMDPDLFTLTGNGEIQVSEAGTYEIGFNLNTNSTSNTRATARGWLERDPGGGGAFAPVADMESFAYNRNTTSGRDTVVVSPFPVDLTVDDLLRVQVEEFGTTQGLVTLAGSRFMMKRIA